MRHRVTELNKVGGHTVSRGRRPSEEMINNSMRLVSGKYVDSMPD